MGYSQEQRATYLDLRNLQISQYNRIKANHRQPGVADVDGASIFDAECRERYPKELPGTARHHMVSQLAAMPDATLAAQDVAHCGMARLCRKYHEIMEFM